MLTILYDNNCCKTRSIKACELSFWVQNGTAKSKNNRHFYFFFQIINYLLWPAPFLKGLLYNMLNKLQLVYLLLSPTTIKGAQKNGCA
jgi:hypothetical protein